MEVDFEISSPEFSCLQSLSSVEVKPWLTVIKAGDSVLDLVECNVGKRQGGLQYSVV